MHNYHLLTYFLNWLKTRLTGFGLPQLFLPWASAFWAHTPISHTNRWQGFLSFILPKDTRSFSSPTSADLSIKYPSRRNILLHSNDMAEPVQPLDINTLHTVYAVIQLTVESNAEIIANSHWTVDLTYITGIIDLVSHTTCVVCVNFIHKRRDLQFKVDSKWQIFWETFQGNFYLLSKFLSEICWEEIAEETLSVFCFDVWPGTRTLASHLISQHTTNWYTKINKGYTTVQKQQQEMTSLSLQILPTAFFNM